VTSHVPNASDIEQANWEGKYGFNLPGRSGVLL
jgi:hypothetical protein